MDAPIPKQGKHDAIVKPIIPLERPAVKIGEKDKVKSTDRQYHNTPGDNTTGKCTIKIRMYNSGDPEECIIFDDLVCKCIRGQNITTGPQMFQLVQRVLQGDAKVEFNRVYRCTERG